MSTGTKTLVGAVIAGLTMWTLATGSAFAQQTSQSSPKPEQSGCSCCRNMQQMGR